ncbi:MAG TPA: TonB-dependent receptor [Thermoanaerobaculia bacterium]|nr:TonB-dependent receptor [Thermoanaerobaculia bacterium]
MKIVLLGLLLSLAAAELGAASLSGRVTDESGSGLPGATVEIEGGGLERPRIEATDSDGRFRVEGLAAGSYRVSFRLPGFVGVMRHGIALSADAPRSVDAVLHLAVTADVVVTGKKSFPNLADVADAGQSLIGVASAASQGTVSGMQIDERPILRPGEVLETVPGMVISQHSGEGKANQYYLRGFNLDHGTDFATSVAGIPVNMPSHAHGQGYSDLNFVIPELVSGVQYQKGPYAADQGDFSTAGSASIQLVNGLDRPIARVGAGEDGYARALAAQSPRVGNGTLLWALEAAQEDGPWVHPDNAHRYNGVLRYSQRSDLDAFSLTAMGYQSRWNATDQIPDRAVADGQVSRFGSVDPTDGGEASRYSLAADWQHTGEDSLTRVTAYAVDNRLELFSNFTYDLNDPVHGDQIRQVDCRVVTGLKASQQWLSTWLGRQTETTLGLQARNDNIAEDGLFHTQARRVLSTVELDHVLQTSVSAYAESSIRWSERFRTVIGLRADAYRFHVVSDDAANSGDGRRSIVSPKLSLVLGPFSQTELYANVGYGFHSNDARGATITEDPATHQAVARVTPLARARGAEVGLRTLLIPRLQTTVAVWGLDIASELVFLGDAGTTEPSRPSRRIGIEVANYWSASFHLVFDADLAFSRARFAGHDPAGDYIPGSVESVVSAGVSLVDVGDFFGSLRLRYFGPRPLIEDNSVRSASSTLVNAQVGWELTRSARLTVDVFNVLDAKASDIDYYYVSRLPGEPAGGVADLHFHPAQPRAVRAGLDYSF